jgi:hypothetical protein
MADNRYKPPTQVGTRSITLLSLVNKIDPGWSQQKFYDREYPGEAYDSGGFGQRGKYKYANPYHRGPYADD